jgi:hypothetical protein
LKNTFDWDYNDVMNCIVDYVTGGGGGGVAMTVLVMLAIGMMMIMMI